MRSAVILALALVSAVQAESIPGLPSCTSECISSDFGGCGTLDVACICKSTTFIAGLACCISVACDAADQNATITFADSLCEGYGVTTLPKSATCAAGETPSFVSGAVVSTASSATTTSGSGSGSSSVTSAAATTAASSTTASGSSTGTSSSKTSASTGAAGRLDAAAMGVGALVFGALAAL